MTKKVLFLTYLMGGFYSCCFAQNVDTAEYKLTWKNVAIPSVIIMIGLTQIGHESQEFQTEVREDFPFFKSNLDDVAQYVPLGVSLFSGNLGFRFKHDFKARFIYSAISYATMGITVNALKKSIHETRPDFSGDNSFPSGHTAFSFTGAEVLHQELKDAHPILSYAGYPIATGVGLYRMLNNKHYLSDVLLGASIGVLSAKLAYAIYHPKENNSFKKSNFNIYPSTVLGKNGVSIIAKF